MNDKPIKFRVFRKRTEHSPVELLEWTYEQYDAELSMNARQYYQVAGQPYATKAYMVWVERCEEVGLIRNEEGS